MANGINAEGALSTALDKRTPGDSERPQDLHFRRQEFMRPSIIFSPRGERLTYLTGWRAACAAQAAAQVALFLADFVGTPKLAGMAVGPPPT